MRNEETTLCFDFQNISSKFNSETFCFGTQNENRYITQWQCIIRIRTSKIGKGIASPFLSKQKVQKFRGNGSFRRKTVPLRNIHPSLKWGATRLPNIKYDTDWIQQLKWIIQKKSNQQTSVKKLMFASSCWDIIAICQSQKIEVFYGAITLNEFPGVYEVEIWLNSVNSMFTIILFSKE